MNQDKEFLGTQPIGKLLFKLAIPTVIAQLVNMLYNIVDRIYIGHIPGEGSLALTGVGVCMPIIMIVSAFACLVSAGAAPRASIAMGKGDHESAEKILGGCVTLQIMISLALTIVILIWNRDLLLLFGASENTISYATSYMSLYALGTIFVQMTLGLNAFITAQGFAKDGMMTVLIGAVINIILDPIFIFALHMGVRGAALATILSQACSCIWCIYFLLGKKTLLRIRKANLRSGLSLMPACVALGLSAFIMQSTESIISMCFNSSLLKYCGDVAVGAMTILTSVMQFAMLPLQGIGQGAQPIMSFNYGAGKYRRGRKTYLLALAAASALSIVAFVAFQFFPRQIISAFGEGSELYFQFSERYFRIYMFLTIVNGIQPVTSNFFNSIGKARLGVFMSLTRQILFLLPLIIIFPIFMGIDGVMYAGPIADGITAIVCGVFTGRELKELTSIDRDAHEKAVKI